MSLKRDVRGAKIDNNRAPIHRPYYIFFGFLLLGAALALVIFGGNLLNSSTSDDTGDSAPTLLDQVSDLSEIPVNPADSSQSDGYIDVGDKAPNFTLFDLDETAVKLTDFRGQPVIMNLWATWCAPCRIEMPALQDAVENYSDYRLEILALNQGETADVARQYFYDEMNLTFTPLLDEDSAVAALYGGLNVLPTTYFINQEGVVSAIHRGPLTNSQIDGYLGEIINNSS